MCCAEDISFDFGSKGVSPILTMNSRSQKVVALLAAIKCRRKQDKERQGCFSRSTVSGK